MDGMDTTESSRFHHAGRLEGLAGRLDPNEAAQDLLEPEGGETLERKTKCTLPDFAHETGGSCMAGRRWSSPVFGAFFRTGPSLTKLAHAARGG